ncbi:MAG: hypothetical protein H0X38_01180 [Planctomycetes bacterium]|nr:hypothetical protein [Planctomycetota bacterium]
MTDDEFCLDLIKTAPVLISLYHRHISDYDELLPTVFLADIARSMPGTPEVQATYLKEIEKVLATPKHPQWNLVASGFIEGLRGAALFNIKIYPKIADEWLKDQG